MSKRHVHEQLSVLLAGTPIGTLSMLPTGMLAFQYDENAAMPLSVNFPLDSDNVYQGKNVNAWFDGVLPDNILTRISMARNKSYSYNSTFGLLSDYGYDLPGAVQVVPSDKIDSLLEEPALYTSVTPEQVGVRLAKMVKESELSGGTRWHVRGEHWSLAGGQPKIALMKDPDGTYFECHGLAASNVIVKPGVPKMECQAELEHVCMEIARELELPCAKSFLVRFGDITALVVERYDRRFDANGIILRLHQEDFCQALGVPPDNKYVGLGNPFKDSMGLLSSSISGKSRSAFVDSVLFNYLIGAPDAHLKNYSLMFPGCENCQMAPLYDVASILPYLGSKDTSKVAMAVGGEKRIGQVGKSALSRMADELGWQRQAFVEHYMDMAMKVAEGAERVFGRMPDTPEIETLDTIFKPRLQYHCERTVENITSHHFSKPNFFAASYGKTLDDGNGNKDFESSVQASDEAVFVPPRIEKTSPASDKLKAMAESGYPSAASGVSVPLSAEGVVWVEPHMRKGKRIRGHWRSRPKRKRP